MSDVLKSYGWSFEYISKLCENYIPVHPEVAGELKRLCDKNYMVDEILAQDFLKPDKLLKIVTYCNDENKVHWLLAMDGLSGTDPKSYLNNLRFSILGEGNRYDIDRIDYKHSHARAVRNVYRVLADTKYEKRVDGVYQVMRKVLKLMAGIEIPLPDSMEPLDPQIMEKCIRAYEKKISWMHFDTWLEELKPGQRTIETPVDEDGCYLSTEQRKDRVPDL